MNVKKIQSFKRLICRSNEEMLCFFRNGPTPTHNEWQGHTSIAFQSMEFSTWYVQLYQNIFITDLLLSAIEYIKHYKKNKKRVSLYNHFFSQIVDDEVKCRYFQWTQNYLKFKYLRFVKIKYTIEVWNFDQFFKGAVSMTHITII